MDIGAYEASSSYLVNSTAESTDAGTLQAAIGWAELNTNANPAAAINPVPNTVVVAAAGAYVLAAPDLQALDSDLAAISNSVVTADAPVSITIDLGPATYENVDGNGDTAPIEVTAPAGVALTLDGPTSGTATLYDLQTSGTVTLQGNIQVNGDSPALVVNSGVTTVADRVTLVTATSAPTIQVNGGTLVSARQHGRADLDHRVGSPLSRSTAGASIWVRRRAPAATCWTSTARVASFRIPTSAPVSDEGDTLEVDAAPLPSSDLSLTTLNSSAVSTTYGQSVTLTATVVAAHPADGTPTGSVKFVDTTTGVDLGTVPLSGGVAQLTTGALTAGSHTINAEYLGNSTFAFSVNTLTQAVSPAPLTVTANPATRVYGQSNPTFSVAFSGFVLGQGPGILTTSPTLSTTATATSPVGTYPITAGGAVDTNYSISYVNGTLTINADPTTSTATASPSTASLGQTVTFKATVTANAPGSGTPTGTVDFFDTTTNTDLTPGGVALSSGDRHVLDDQPGRWAATRSRRRTPGRTQLPDQQRHGRHGHDRPDDLRPRSLRRRGPEPFGQREHQHLGRRLRRFQLVVGPVGQRRSLDQGVGHRRARRGPEERQPIVQPGAGHRRRRGRRPARFAAAAEHVRPDQLRRREPLRQLLRDDQAGHLFVDQRLGKRQPHHEQRHLHHRGRRVLGLRRRQRHRLGRDRSLTPAATTPARAGPTAASL